MDQQTSGQAQADGWIDTGRQQEPWARKGSQGSSHGWAFPTCCVEIARRALAPLPLTSDVSNVCKNLFLINNLGPDKKRKVKKKENVEAIHLEDLQGYQFAVPAEDCGV